MLGRQCEKATHDHQLARHGTDEVEYFFFGRVKKVHVSAGQATAMKSAHIIPPTLLQLSRAPKKRGAYFRFTDMPSKIGHAAATFAELAEGAGLLARPASSANGLRGLQHRPGAAGEDERGKTKRNIVLQHTGGGQPGHSL